ncbi:hypothetical protein A3A76_03320 [Candidatus Woesebacteria bacterium RIFCSPLOWO2_01_FULL_39_23]|uniref:Bacterial Ig domain-containing protein n=1 Tax=Candidatus Woesebacteria bacterium RIFCSPHIGHO2_01_FULL_40_22 TaxID=1802499 RepID=A0A1F7YJP0_9BACT|nr:MAG: hypothetical protein A2141_00705 [Candidatus Woesebacteria bacterium RBG_16_40_11]OGM27487.1 MAG: hypothetical protein A2628_01720 [Candidatus Woesebacteria bacterium RIFCSPHIGHO2_01_FULL_40_22]OGM36556.1 MAG: hypothetical protein A3E41_03925 [Candidatus Woesebacteria bacterium RIFCSPHIGHO2_12_FULL_38_9]OGM62661.1 MAG: hypothetical protein A3A76_03320 [Candidatus Woesebacteria bacterium RIFCSPLOWO2_01_FULL_39_23]
MTKYYSYKSRTEDKQITQSTFKFFFLTLIAISTIFFFGIPVLTKFSEFLTNINKSSKVEDRGDKIPPPPPRINQMPIATNKNKLQINGNTEAGAIVKLYLNSENTETVANSSGDFLFTVILDEGDNELYAVAIDKSGNISSTTETAVVEYDKTEPTIVIAKPADSSSFYGTKQKRVTIEGSTEAQAALTINDRFVLVNDDGKFNYIYNLQEGENKLTIKAQDPAGNSSEKLLTLFFTS